ncbi:GalNAc-alpha-(1-_4)-GalNAc-alpha-(1-_3)- diNAcBac-PP-undecaprenol alpha-1,4-N-acetyl-D-galactosaminyltransferase [Kordia sp. SMS9]|uniref:glycosyltransferase family 4 protein n=1 Tax=Kordia sp. SMS9 TaxID=2282170 RepID=UPI000E0DEF4D|nr:glycosyltransferase family 4 protein [Kordia sp. SMS9]AXG72333.1 GalNAc-alpha-(1->4)-GalNAc-alpha-(1->3)- diNAcBac-PP-undecaprenol alpha-1,4-N-acetyl-D-galactosaminyltransferase [Kordia sp. SMS9]
MLQNSKKKICLIVECLSGGGAEKQAANFSKSLQKYGFEVSIISLKDQITYDFAGTLYNLGKNESSIKIIKQIQKFFAFKKAYKTCNADMYIDFRARSRFVMEYLLHKFIFEAKKMILMVHSYHIEWHIPKGKLFREIYNKTHAIVAVSEAIELKLGHMYDFENLLHIPNYITAVESTQNEKTPVKDDYIIAVGRLQNDIKQFDRLVETYHASKLAEKNIKLYICGDGNDKESLENLISKLHLQAHVKLLGFVENVTEYIQNATYLILSSRVEGFPMVLLEALQQKTPVISFDCKSGPSEIIQHKTNGLLVEDQNFANLKEAMLLLIENMELYMNCKQNAVYSISKFTEENVIQQWVQLINV